MQGRIASSNITDLDHKDVFVFGSNLSGFHAGGAARAALQWGAVNGQGIGHHGKTYAIPTIGANFSGPLDLSEISKYVDDFIAYATKHPELKFLVTEIGCGIAGFNVEQIAPLFEGAVDLNNVMLPLSFWHVLNNPTE
jgi:hypothetical protein